MNRGFTINQTDMFVNCPVVPEGSTLENNKMLTQGWYNGQEIYYFDFGANPDTVAPIWVLITGMDNQGNPQMVEGQRNIIDVVPGDPNYTAFWQVNLVTVPKDYTANTLKSAEAVRAADYPIQTTNNLVNCPVYQPASPSPSPAASPATSPSPTPSLSPSPTGQAVTIDLVAQNIAFDKNTITVPAGAMVTINFDNQDAGIPHNFAAYMTSAAQESIFVGQIFNGVATMTYRFTAPSTPGEYFFRCDAHPTTMTGTFIVQ